MLCWCSLYSTYTLFQKKLKTLCCTFVIIQHWIQDTFGHKRCKEGQHNIIFDLSRCVITLYGYGGISQIHTERCKPCEGMCHNLAVSVSIFGQVRVCKKEEYASTMDDCSNHVCTRSLKRREVFRLQRSVARKLEFRLVHPVYYHQNVWATCSRQAPCRPVL